MDFIAYETSAISYLFLGGVALGFLLIIGALFSEGSGLMACLGFLIFFASVMGGIFLSDSTQSWSKDARAEIKDHYGLTLSEKQFTKLKYPQQKEEPEGDFEQYGSVTVVKPDGDNSFEKVDVYLLWSDGEMVLASPDEQKKLQLLKARG